MSSPILHLEGEFMKIADKCLLYHLKTLIRHFKNICADSFWVLQYHLHPLLTFNTNDRILIVISGYKGDNYFDIGCTCIQIVRNISLRDLGTMAYTLNVWTVILALMLSVRLMTGTHLLQRASDPQGFNRAWGDYKYGFEIGRASCRERV